MTYYCINCWHEIKKDTVVCPHCGYDQKEAANISFTDKLIKSLEHPEPETPIRAALILGELKISKAVPELIFRLKSEKDPYIIKAFTEALLMIDPNLIDEIRKVIGDNPPVTVKKILEL
ncbi:MAG TPA: hypothetical protein PKD67_11510 [Ignavibacteriaceae bacterium]|nr:hypothetical protein [Ignavibacteriaceae bacterium]